MNRKLQQETHNHEKILRELNIGKSNIRIELEKCYLKKCPKECSKGEIYDSNNQTCKKDCGPGKKLENSKCIDLKCPPDYNMTKDFKCEKIYCDPG